MIQVRVLLSRLVGLVRGRARDARLSEEVQAHLDALTAEHIAAGLSPDDARLAARRNFGGVDQVHEAHRDQHRVMWLDALGRDVRHSVRRLRAEPWFSAAVTAALAIGIAGTVSVVGAVTAIGWSQPPFRDPGGVWSIGTIDDRGQRADVSWLEFQEWRDEARGFDELAAFSGAFFTLGADGRAAERVQGAYVSATTFALLGLIPERGRDFLPEDDRPGAPSVALINAGTATSLLGGLDQALGATVMLDGVPTTIVGIMPAHVTFPLTGTLWRPLAQQAGLRESGRERRGLGTVVRLSQGVDQTAALRELEALASRAAGSADRPGSRTRPTLVTFRERFMGRTTEAAPLALLVASGMILLIGCATAATLLLARSAYRVEEITMRLALGASRSRLMGQLMVECAVNAGIAGLLGLGAAHVALRQFGDALAGAGLPPWAHFGIDLRVVGITTVATVASVLLGGLAPAWRVTGMALSGAPGRQRVTSSRPTQRWIRGLLAAKVALTLVLLSTSGYLLTGALALWRADQIVDTTGVVTARLGLTGPRYASSNRRLALYADYVERLRARGELHGASITTAPPFSPVPNRRVAVGPIEGSAPAAVTARVVSIDAHYFTVSKLGLLAGRSFDAADDNAPQVAVVNAAFAAAHFGGNALGQRIQVAPSATEGPGGPWLTVVGVAPSIRHSGRPEAEPAVYVPLAYEAPATVFVMARAEPGIPAAEILRDRLHTIDGTLPLYAWQTLERMATISRWTVQTIGSIVVLLGGLALTLAALGIYAVTAYAAGRRVKEAGIRLAVGAGVADITRLFLTDALWPVGIGLAIGTAGAWAASKALIAIMLQGVPVGTTMILPAGVAVAVVALVAGLVPARRVAVVDPLHALRCD